MPNNYNPYGMNYQMQNQVQNLQDLRDRIDRQMQQVQQNQNQFMQQQQQPQIQQTFQLSNPNQNNSDFDGKYAESIEDVKNTLVFKNSLFVNKDMSKMWIKDTVGNIRIFNLEEEIQVDENIAEINNLKKELSEVKALLIQQTKKLQQVETEKEPIAKIQPVTKIEKKK